MSTALRAVAPLIVLLVVVVLSAPLAVAQVLVVPAPPAPGPFGGMADTAPTRDLGLSGDLFVPSADSSTPDKSTTSAPPDAGSEPNPPDPSVDSAPPVGGPADSSPQPGDGAPFNISWAPDVNVGGGRLPVPVPMPGPGLSPPLPGGVTAGPRPGAPNEVTGPTTSAPRTVAAPTSAPRVAAATSGWLRRLLPAADFWLWLLELLPLILQAVLAGLAALLSAWVLPPGGVVWRLPPELTHQFSAIGPAHAATAALADAALAAIVALVGLGHLLGPRAELPVLAPRELAPRIAVAVLVAHGSLAIGAGRSVCRTPCWAV